MISSACATCGCLDNSCQPCTTTTACSNCNSCCCTPAHSSWRRGRIGRGVAIECLSSAWMGVEFAASIALGLMAGSLALLAFGGDSLIELLSGFVVLSHLRKDASSSAVHGRRTELLTSSLLFALIPVIGLGAFYSYISGLRPEGSPLGITLAFGAVIMMPYLWLEKKGIGRETRSLPLSMDAVESVTCFFMSVALLGGLLAEYFLGLWWADYLATAMIMIFVAREAIESYRELREED